MSAEKTDPQVKQLEKIANRLRILSIRETTKAGSGHPSSCCSAADLVACLFFWKMRFDPKNPRYPGNDRFVLSKGHAAPLLYAAWSETGHLPEAELDRLREIDSPLEGHPTPRLDFVDVATGSLGQGLSAGAGMAINSRIEKLGYNVYVLLGDGELAEGSVWEGANFAGIRKLNNLVAILDVNRLGQNGETAFGHHTEVYQKRFEAFGWKTVSIDGHSIPEIMKALAIVGTSEQGERPLCIVARTIKGKGIPGVEDQPNWHGKPLPEELARKAIDSLEPNAASARGVAIPAPAKVSSRPEKEEAKPAMRAYGDKPVATRKAFGNALVRLGENPDLVVLDGDVGNSTHTDEFRDRFPERFIECYIGEQNMVGAAVGLARMGRIPVCATFGAFFTRALDQIRMGAISFANLKLVGTHNGVSIGEDGTSQMGLEDVAVMRAIHGSTILCPSDAVSTERILELALDHEGLTYVRTARPATPILYGSEERFEIGGAKILRQDPHDRVTVVAAGVSVFEALAAQKQLSEQGTEITVVDAYSIKPLARKLILECARKTGNLVVTVEDHYPEGGLGEAVSSELSSEGIRVERLAVYELPHSGKQNELFRKYRIDAQAIVERVKKLLNKAKSQAA